MPLDTFNSSHVLHRKFLSQPDKVISAAGIALRLDTGQEVLDASAGASVSILGQGRREIAEAIAQQILTVACVYSGANHTSTSAEELGDIILADKPGGLSKAFFANSGSEATEVALKLATQYWHERQLPQKKYIIARKQSYHGNTVGALSVSGHASRRSLYGDWLSTNVAFVEPCYAYRLKKSGETDEEYVQRLMTRLENVIVQLGPETVSSFIAETVSGTSLGCVAAPPGYFKAVRELCNKYDILLILDEVMCGMGKTGTMHAWEQEEISGPDIQTIGKALGGGYIPLSGVLLHERIYHAIKKGTGILRHSFTFQAHPTACAAALIVQKIIRRDKLLSNVVRQGKVLERLLRNELAQIPTVGDIRGRGLFWSVEFMLDPVNMVQYPVESGISDRVVVRARQLGLNILGNIGTTGEIHVEHIIICPAYTVNEQDLTRMVAVLKRAILDTCGDSLDESARLTAQSSEQAT